MRGYFGIGIYHSKIEDNIGTLFRSAKCFGADFIFVIGRRYSPQCSDTCKSYKSVPLFEYKTFDSFMENLPREARLVGIELKDDAKNLGKDFIHPEQAVYLLGAEDYGLPEKVLNECRQVVQIPGLSHCLNVSTAGSIVMYDRLIKQWK